MFSDVKQGRPSSLILFMLFGSRHAKKSGFEHAQNERIHASYVLHCPLTIFNTIELPISQKCHLIHKLLYFYPLSC